MTSLKKKSYFDKDITPLLKGIAIIIMIFHHLFNSNWMIFHSRIVDITLNNTFLCEILSRSGDICIGIFAFITGYGLSQTTSNKKTLSRVGGVYRTYWVILLFFSSPIYLLFSYLSDHSLAEFDLHKILMAVLAFDSKSVMFQWYLYFFVLALVSYKPLVYMLERVRINAIVKIYATCFLFILFRFTLGYIFRNILKSELILSIESHYCTWMPVLITGYITGKESLFEILHEKLAKLMENRVLLLFNIIILLTIYIGKSFIQFFTNKYSNLDSIIMFPFMYALCGLANCFLHHKHMNSIFSFMGRLSMYLWLTHRFLLYEPVQDLLFHLRLPLLIVIVGISIMIPIALVLFKMDRSVTFLIKKHLDY